MPSEGLPFQYPIRAKDIADAVGMEFNMRELEDYLAGLPTGGTSSIQVAGTFVVEDGAHTFSGTNVEETLNWDLTPVDGTENVADYMAVDPDNPFFIGLAVQGYWMAVLKVSGIDSADYEARVYMVGNANSIGHSSSNGQIGPISGSVIQSDAIALGTLGNPNGVEAVVRGNSGEMVSATIYIAYLGPGTIGSFC